MLIKKAHIHDSEILTQITMASKAFWGYSDEQMAIWSDSLCITETYIETKEVYKLIMDKAVIAYYSFYEQNLCELKLDNLFILPEFIGKGFGSILMKDFLTRIQNMGIKKIILESDPHAEKFYEKFGFARVGKIETSIKDRFLPLMELKLDIN